MTRHVGIYNVPFNGWGSKQRAGTGFVACVNQYRCTHQDGIKNCEWFSKKQRTVNVILVSLAAKASYIRPSAVKKIIYSVTKTCPELQALKEGCWGKLWSICNRLMTVYNGNPLHHSSVILLSLFLRSFVWIRFSIHCWEDNNWEAFNLDQSLNLKI